MLHDSSPRVTLSRDGLLINPEKLSLVARSRTPDESPNSIVLESAVERSDRTPSPSSRKVFEEFSRSWTCWDLMIVWIIKNLAIGI